MRIWSCQRLRSDLGRVPSRDLGRVSASVGRTCRLIKEARFSNNSADVCGEAGEPQSVLHEVLRPPWLPSDEQHGGPSNESTRPGHQFGPSTARSPDECGVSPSWLGIIIELSAIYSPPPVEARSPKPKRGRASESNKLPLGLAASSVRLSVHRRVQNLIQEVR